MSKFDEWMKSYYIEHGFISSREEMESAWNARGKVDAEICEQSRELELAEAIEQEDEHG